MWRSACSQYVSRLQTLDDVRHQGSSGDGGCPIPAEYQALTW
jgi:hypothetical protein